jgi:hypothetical protein
MKDLHKNTLLKLAAVIMLVITALIIHSCRKDSKQTTSPNTNIAVDQARAWYESTYPVSTNANTPHQTINSISNTQFDFSQHIKPAWKYASNYAKLGKNVIEMPLDSSALLDFNLKNVSATASYYDKKYTRAYFLLMNDGKNYEAYVMMVIADPAYVKNDMTKLAHNTYRKYDADFSGIVLYFTPKGEYLNGYAFQNGQLLGAPATSTQTIQSTTDPKLKIDLSAPVKCTDFYLITYDKETGEILDAQYLYTTCSPDVSGSGDSGGGSGAPPPPTCTPPPPPVVQSTGHLIINVATPPPGGFPPPAPPCPPNATILDTVSDPCAQASAAKANQKFIDEMNYLKSLMNTPGETTEVMEPNGSFKQQTSTINGGADLTFPPNYFNGSTGFLHNHGKGAGILSVFSAPDLASLYSIVTQGGVANPGTYTFALVNQDGQSYLLTISNMSNFIAWGNTNLINGDPSPAFNQTYNSFIKSTNSDAMNENDFVNLLNLTNSGLTLMKANSTNTSWSQVVKNSDGTYSIIPCNN